MIPEANEHFGAEICGFRIDYKESISLDDLATVSQNEALVILKFIVLQNEIIITWVSGHQCVTDNEETNLRNRN